MSQTPTNYWSDNKAPTGTWGTESVSYGDAALDNLTRSPLSDSNILNIGNLDNLTRLAGSLGSLFGGGGSDQLFSAPSGMAFIKKITVAIAVIFIFTSLILTITTSRIELRSVTQSIPAIPVQPPLPGQ